MRSSTRLPLTVRVTGTSPGPTRRGPVCASTSGAATVVTALATPVRPADLRKSRRLKLSDIGGSYAWGLAFFFVRNAEDADLAVLAFALGRAARHQRHVLPAREPFGQLGISIPEQPL